MAVLSSQVTASFRLEAAPSNVQMKQQRCDVASRSVYNRKRWDSNQSPSPNRAADKVRQIWTEAA
jgi:hypothetical protein